MRVRCYTVDEFLGDLALEDPSHILQQVVRVSTTRNPMGNNGRDKVVKHGVVFQASAVVALDGGGEYLLECGVDCGIDYEDASQEFVGSVRAGDLKQQIIEFCQCRQLSIRPGMIEP